MFFVLLQFEIGVKTLGITMFASNSVSGFMQEKNLKNQTLALIVRVNVYNSTSRNRTL